jgi:SAM-dependent methyltransferase
MTILNLGCGAKTSPLPEVVNLDWSLPLRLKANPISRTLVRWFVKGDRLQRFNALPDNIKVHNLARGIPFAPGSVDAVYHSHFLEHLDREVAARFMAETWRVLRPGGVQRIVVPDLESVCQTYLAHLARADLDATEAARHDDYVAQIIEQSVRRVPFGTDRHTALRRTLERALFGDARGRGETHQWLYDRINLAALLRSAGFVDSTIMAFSTSAIPGWERFRLDVDGAGNEYKPGSLYIEARKPTGTPA